MVRTRELASAALYCVLLVLLTGCTIGGIDIPESIPDVSMPPIPSSVPFVTSTPAPSAVVRTTQAPTPTPTVAATAVPSPTSTPAPSSGPAVSVTPVPSPTPEPEGSGTTTDGYAGTDFADVDGHALDTAFSASGSVDELALELTATWGTDVEKARAIYAWITDNIAYDVERYEAGVGRNLEALEVIQAGRAVCGGYANLFEAMSDAAGLDVRTVSGWSRGHDSFFMRDELDEEPNHAWTVITLDGSFYLIDSTWGAGYVAENKSFVKRFNPFYFLTPPEQMIYSHLPEDKLWQLLDTPVSKDEFTGLPLISNELFELGIELLPFDDAIIRSENELVFNFTVPDDVYLTGRLEREGVEVDGSAVLIQKRGVNSTVHCILNEKGSYSLKLFGKKGTEVERYAHIVSYSVRTDTTRAEQVQFPQTYSTFTEREWFIAQPLRGNLIVGAKVPFVFRIPSADKAALITEGNKWHHLVKDGDTFSAMLSVPEGTIQVCALYGAGRDYDCGISYTGTAGG